MSKPHQSALDSRGDLIQAELSTVALWPGLGDQHGTGVCLIMGACHGGDVFVIAWLPATPAPTSCQPHMVQMFHPGNKCQAMSAQRPQQEVVAAQWTPPTLDRKGIWGT